MDNKKDDNDILINRLENELMNIEKEEILSGLSEKKFDIDDSLKTDSQYGIHYKDLVFSPNVEFKEYSAKIDFDSIKIEDISHIPDVNKDELIAVTKSSASKTDFVAEKNTCQKSKDKKTYFYSKVKGKVVIIGNTVNVLPSDVDSKIEVSVSKDSMEVYVDLYPSHGNGKKLKNIDIVNKLHKMGIKSGILTTSIKEAIDYTNDTKNIKQKVIVAKGIQPKTGDDGKIEYFFDLESKDNEFTILPDGRIDYKGNKKINVAQKNDKLAKIVDPKDGIDGSDVYGNILQAFPGKPANLVAGNGVFYSEEEKIFYAKSKGNIVINGPFIEVHDSYIIDGDVDYSSGSIDFNGNVIINGDVKDGFSVKAGGDIIIKKNVEAADLEAGRDIKIFGGIQGRGKGTVIAGRNIHTDYCQNSNIEAKGSVYIGNFSVNSVICTSGKLFATSKKGTVIGGEIYAQKGGELKNVGSEAGKKTYIEIGTNYLVSKKLKEMKEAADFYLNNIDKIERSLKPVLDILNKENSILKNKMELIKSIIKKRNEFKSRLKIVKVKEDEFRKLLNEKEDCFFKVYKNCYSDVFIKIKEMKIVTKKKLVKIMFLEDKKNETIKSISI